MRWRYPAVDLPGINLNFSAAPSATAPTKGRMLDHIGFEVGDLDAFVRSLGERGIAVTSEGMHSTGLQARTLTDPWGTTIELTEGLAD